MWKRRLLVLACLSLNALAVSPFQKYGDEFEALAKANGIPTARYLVRFGKPDQAGNLSSTNIGFCDPQREGHNIVTIDEKFWRSTTEECRRALFFHEAGHCALRKNHSGEGIMRPKLNCQGDVMELFR